MSSKYPTTASNSASEAEELKNRTGLGAVSKNSLKKVYQGHFQTCLKKNSKVNFPSPSFNELRMIIA